MKTIEGLGEQAVLAASDARKERFAEKHAKPHPAPAPAEMPRKPEKKKEAAKKKDQKKKPVAMRPEPAAKPVIRRSALMGIADKVHLRWRVGALYIGNGTRGVAGYGYLDCYNAADYIVIRDTSDGGYGCPIMPQDAYVGEPYCADVLKHFARIRYHKILLHMDTTTAATSSNAVFAIAPTEGASQVGAVTTTGTSTSTVLQLSDVEGMDGAVTVRAWDNVTINMTPYIAGGSGAKQNEFDLNEGFNHSLASGYSGEFRGVVPCCFVVGGANGTSGAAYHNVWCEAWIDLLDFLANATPSNIARARSPLERGAAREARLAREAALDKLLASAKALPETTPVTPGAAADVAAAHDAAQRMEKIANELAALRATAVVPAPAKLV